MMSLDTLQEVLTLKFSQAARRVSQALTRDICASQNGHLSALHARYDRAAAQVRVAFSLFEEKAGFKWWQSRWPKGSGRNSGRWSGDGGATRSTAGAGATPSTAGGGTTPRAGTGHHYVPRSVFTNSRLALSEDAKRVFERGVTGTLGERHRFTEQHMLYNRAVGETLDRFMAERAIRGPAMTASEAEEFLEQIKRSKDERIFRFNRDIRIRQLFQKGGISVPRSADGG